MDLDHFTIALATLHPDAPQLDDEAADALQDAHLAFLAGLHEQGHLLAGGPLQHDHYRGLSIFRLDLQQTLELRRRDPAVEAGRLAIETIAWMVPAGAISFAPAGFPRSLAEADS